MYARFVRPLLATILCMGNLVPAYTMNHVFPCLKKKITPKNQKHIIALILKPTDDQKLETYYFRPNRDFKGIAKGL